MDHLAATGSRSAEKVTPASRYAALSYFVVAIDYGRRGLEAIVDPEITRREVVSRIRSGEYKDIAFIHEITMNDVPRDVTAELIAEADAEPANMGEIFRAALHQAAE